MHTETDSTAAKLATRNSNVAALARRAIFFGTLLLLWQLVAWLRLWPDYLFPGPLDVGQTLMEGIRNGLFLRAAWASMQRIALGYGISLALGLGLGIAIARSRWLEDTLGSLVIGLQALPSVCWLPLAVLWFGLNERAVLFVVVMGALFSIVLGVTSGLKNTPPIFTRAARNLGARGMGLYAQVIIPAALPHIVAGLKQGWSFAWRSLMSAELMFYSLSLGNLLQTGRDLNDVTQVMAVMVMIVALGVAVTQLLFGPIERAIRERWGFDLQ